MWSNNKILIYEDRGGIPDNRKHDQPPPLTWYWSRILSSLAQPLRCRRTNYGIGSFLSNLLMCPFLFDYHKRLWLMSSHHTHKCRQKLGWPPLLWCIDVFPSFAGFMILLSTMKSSVLRRRLVCDDTKRSHVPIWIEEGLF